MLGTILKPAYLVQFFAAANGGGVAQEANVARHAKFVGMQHAVAIYKEAMWIKVRLFAAQFVQFAQQERCFSVRQKTGHIRLFHIDEFFIVQVLIDESHAIAQIKDE